MDTEQELEALRFPIGRWQQPESVSESELMEFQRTLSSFPAMLRAQVGDLEDFVLDTPYRPEGWTVRQVVHHVADSHLNCLIRFKLTLTEDKPAIKPYAEDRWAQLPDYGLPVEPSIRLLELIHPRLDVVISHMHPHDWNREYIHPEHGRAFRLDQVASLYAWHCRHHLGHIRLVTSGST
ncbi:MAG: hypothetical protein RLZZ165_2439 [Bacteroidota bacterium]|jgi:hypothetical protein